MKPARMCKNGDGYPAMKGRQACGWCWLAKQPAAVQTHWARERFLAAPPQNRVARVPAAKWPAGTRFCGGCKSFVPLFYTTGSRCKACASAASHHGRIEKTYGIGTREYNAILAVQQGRCAICGNVPRTKRLAVEHDHKTGEVRGLCCKRCNRDLLGAAHDDVELLRRAIKYLENPPAREVLATVAP